MSAKHTTAAAPVRPASAHELVGDHPVMDLLNTVVKQEGELVDLWRDDASVLGWLERMGWPAGVTEVAFRHGRLLDAARHLREIVRRLVIQRKQHKPLDLAELNEFLARGRSYCELTRTAKGMLQAVRRHEARTPEQLLGPLAEASAEFLATADFDLVRPCEGEGCVLWFYDRTKSHRRRWCSMSMCGNRHKVAAFRSRNS